MVTCFRYRRIIWILDDNLNRRKCCKKRDWCHICRNYHYSRKLISIIIKQVSRVISIFEFWISRCLVRVSWTFSNELSFIKLIKTLMHDNKSDSTSVLSVLCSCSFQELYVIFVLFLSSEEHSWYTHISVRARVNIVSIRVRIGYLLYPRHSFKDVRRAEGRLRLHLHLRRLIRSHFGLFDL